MIRLVARYNPTAVRHSLRLPVSSVRLLSVNSGINQGLRAESRSRRPSRSSDRTTSAARSRTPGREERFPRKFGGGESSGRSRPFRSRSDAPEDSLRRQSRTSDSEPRKPYRDSDRERPERPTSRFQRDPNSRTSPSKPWQSEGSRSSAPDRSRFSRFEGSSDRPDRSSSRFEKPSRSEAPSSRFGRPSSNTRFEKPASRFEKPTSKFGMPPSRFEKPASRFETPTSRFERPTSRFERPTSRFEKPTSRFERPSKPDRSESRFSKPSTREQSGSRYERPTRSARDEIEEEESEDFEALIPEIDDQPSRVPRSPRPSRTPTADKYGSKRPRSTRVEEQEDDDNLALHSETSPSELRPGTKAPNGMPITTATSEFVFGRNAVLSVLRGGRRKMYKLYIHKRALGDEKDAQEFYKELRDLAHESGIEVTKVGQDWLPLMNHVAKASPHNGCILEASRLPTPAVTHLAKYDMEKHQDSFIVNVGPSSLAKVDRPRKATTNPVVVLPCNLTNTANLGAMLRSAYWFGIDAVALPERGSAKTDTTTLKTSSGASEGVNIFTVRKIEDFVTKSKEAGWEVVSALPPNPKQRTNEAKSTIPIPSADSQLAKLRQERPVLLLLGGEEHGVPFDLLKHVQTKVSIAGGEDDKLGVDSLNVSVAASLIFAELAKPTRVGAVAKDDLESDTGTTTKADQEEVIFEIDDSEEPKVAAVASL
ncbi:hypothetical protein BT63DRAFT_450518 [Microthyrium microscopicum]|uniref:rRNA methyltransferase 1, mitochondrial n=1 Tax=Microthyrium microscopicum TaxID=703497 RepID=A0A6A6UTS2_9PEZI|nr:hypothetical protein BT63DRAFT_450518 [Microthyrium microscopicum]